MHTDPHHVGELDLSQSNEPTKSGRFSHTFYLAYEGPLPRARERTVKTDITIRERIVLGLEDRPILRGYEEYRDLPEDARVRAYSLSEVAVEMTVALLDRARNEPRDLYDLWFLTSGGHVDLSDLADPVARKLEFRGLALAQVGKEFAAKEARYEKLWQVRLDPQMVGLPEYGAVYREVRRALRHGGFIGWSSRSPRVGADGAAPRLAVVTEARTDELAHGLGGGPPQLREQVRTPSLASS